MKKINTAGGGGEEKGDAPVSDFPYYFIKNMNTGGVGGGGGEEEGDAAQSDFIYYFVKKTNTEG